LPYGKLIWIHKDLSKDLFDMSFDIEDYLFKLYNDNKINGFDSVQVIGNKIQLDIQKPGQRGADGWELITFVVDRGKKLNTAYDNAMKGV